MIGRQREANELLEAFKSEYSEFVAVYGRRRIGKTFLVREVFDYKFTFQHSGVKTGNGAIQRERFRKSVMDQGYPECPPLGNWFDAFDALKVVIKKSRDRRKVVFIDEMPWMGRSNPDFLTAVEDFWNGWASARKDILFIVCGSATSWILSKIVHNREGLHNRVTYRIPLMPFSLRECEELATSRWLGMNRRQVAECYMVLGGVPYYWQLLRKGLSVAQNVDELFFSHGGKLAGEFEELYASLFAEPAPYMSIISALGRKRCGMTREEIASEAGLANNGALSRRLEELEECGFIRKFTIMGRRKKGIVHQLIDSLTLFHFKFCEERAASGEGFWLSLQDSPRFFAWAGLAFEMLCLQHLGEIRNALGISGVRCGVHAWRGGQSQIDLLIDRSDGIVNLCEMKYSAGKYTITSDDMNAMSRRREDLRAAMKTDKAIHFTFVTAAGVEDNANARDIQSFIDINDLFAGKHAY